MSVDSNSGVAALTALEERQPAAPTEELRIAVVLNGGVSLAVWMGGVSHELNRLSFADDPGRASPYAPLLELTRSTVRIDVIAGSSAGGINGAMLALAESNRSARLSSLRELWSDQGRIESLLRRPFAGQPASLLLGDEYFLPELGRAMTAMNEDFQPTQRRIDLTVTTTLLRGVPEKTIDALGQVIPDEVHSGRFRFRSGADVVDPGEDDFCPGRLAETTAALALAARCSAGFPGAFEPSFVPVDCQEARGAAQTQQRPDLGRYASWRDAADEGRADRSRFVVDGGVLVNTPTRPALEAIDAMPVEQPSRRMLLLVHPHAPVARPDRADLLGEPPLFTQGTAGLLGPLTAQGSRNFVRDIDAHNRQAAGRRGGRLEVLKHSGTPKGLAALVSSVWPFYRAVRLRRTAQDLAVGVPAVPLCSTDRVFAAIEAAHRTWDEQHEGLPYLPSRAPGECDVNPAAAGATGWAWGISVAVGVADAAADLLRRAAGVARPAELTQLTKARKTIWSARSAVVARQTVTDRQKWPDLLLEPSATAPPEIATEGYWTARLAAYENDMLSAEPDSSGRFVACHVDRIVTALIEIEAILRGMDELRRGHASLDPWLMLFHRDGNGNGERPLDRDVLLRRLLALEIATTTVADERATGASFPIDLVQLSLQAKAPFAQFSLTGEEKVAGLSLNRFGGFLKRSWRVNDWIWGRVDAASVICGAVLVPRRLRTVAVLEGRLTEDPEKRSELADRTVTQLISGLFGDEQHALPTVVTELRAQANTELETVLNPEIPVSDLPSSLPKLVQLCVWAMHLRAIGEELPALAAAIRADRVEGANRRSNGEVFLALEQDLVARLSAEAPHASGWVDRGMHALQAFDRAGVGRERLTEEAGSDQLIRTASTAAAVAVTVLDSDRSGLAVAKPLTRMLRGAALLPFWVAGGLTRGGLSARYLALGALAIGGMLLVLSLFGLLPSWAAAPGAAIGLGAVLVGLGYSALRSGTVLHGVVLLSPVLPLLVVAVGQFQQAADAKATVAGLVIVFAALAVVVALIVLGSLPTPVRSPAAAVRSYLERDAVQVAGVPRADVDRDWSAPEWCRQIRWAKRRTAVRLVAAGGLVSVAWLAATRDLTSWFTSWDVPLVLALLALANLGMLVFGWTRAVSMANRLRAYGAPRPRIGDETAVGRQQTMTHPAATTVGWAVVYGAAYSVACWVCAWWMGDRGWGGIAVAIGCAAAAIVLLVVVPIVVPAQTQNALIGSLRREGMLRGTVFSDGDPESEPAEQRFVKLLRRRGVDFAYLVAGGTTLTEAGRDVLRSLTGQEQPRSGLPIAAHLLGIVLGAGLALTWPAPPPGSWWMGAMLLGLLVVVLCALAEARVLRTLHRKVPWPGAGWALLGVVGVVMCVLPAAWTATAVAGPAAGRLAGVIGATLLTVLSTSATIQLRDQPQPIRTKDTGGTLAEGSRNESLEPAEDGDGMRSRTHRDQTGCLEPELAPKIISQVGSDP